MGRTRRLSEVTPMGEDQFILEHDYENEPLVFSKAYFDIIFQEEDSASVNMLYQCYYYTAKWQKTNSVWATTGYIAKKLGWGEDRVRKYKKRLLELGLIEEYQTRNGNLFLKQYIKVKFIWSNNTIQNIIKTDNNRQTDSPTPVKSRGMEKPATGNTPHAGENRETEASLSGSVGSPNDKGTYALSNNTVYALSNDNKPISNRENFVKNSESDTSNNSEISEKTESKSSKTSKKVKVQSEATIIPPTIEMITKYCEDKNIQLNIEKFFYHYEARDWKLKGYVGRMTNWQAAIRTWTINDKEYTNGQNSPKNERSYQSNTNTLPKKFKATSNTIRPPDIIIHRT